MSNLESVLKRLSEGCFVCAVSYPDEYEALNSPTSRAEAEKWLETIGYRLARLGEEGAYFMAHSVVTTEMRARVREEMKTVRSKLDPMVRFLETIRQTQGRNPHILPGDMLWATEISEVARKSSPIERRLIDMREIANVRIEDASPVRIEKMLAQMEAAGYLTLSNRSSKGYMVTGKIDYLYQLINFIATNTSHLSDEGVVDQIDQQIELDDGSQADLVAS